MMFPVRENNEKNDCSTVIFTNLNVIGGEILLTCINSIAISRAHLASLLATFCILHALELEASKCLFPWIFGTIHFQSQRSYQQASRT